MWKPGAVGEDTTPYKWDNAPDSDAEDNENATEGAGAGPDAKTLEPVPGYETVAFNDGEIFWLFQGKKLH